jgi:hypothetical protein
MTTARFQIASGSRSTVRFGLAFAGLILAIPIGFALFGLPRGPVIFTTTAERLRITGDPYGRSFARSELIVAKARLLDLAAEPDYTLTLRTNGIALPAYQSGWFDTRGAGKALVFVSDWSHAVVVPTKLGYVLILAPVHRDQFLFDLQQPFSPNESEHLLATADPDDRGTPRGLPALWAGIFVLPLVVSIFLIWLCLRSRKVVFELCVDALRIKGDLYGRTIPRASLRLDDARLINIKTGPDRLRVLIRTNGVGLPGYNSGWHRARGWASVLLFVTDRSRVVEIPTTLGYTLLISPAAPESFLRAIEL